MNSDVPLKWLCFDLTRIDYLLEEIKVPKEFTLKFGGRKKNENEEEFESIEVKLEIDKTSMNRWEFFGIILKAMKGYEFPYDNDSIFHSLKWDKDKSILNVIWDDP